MLLLDTSSLLLMDAGSSLLGKKAKRSMVQAYQRDELCISAASFWEIAVWVREERIGYSGKLFDWRLELLNAGLVEIPVDGRIFLKSMELGNLDRSSFGKMIVSTALIMGIRLITGDEQLLKSRKINSMSLIT